MNKKEVNKIQEEIKSKWLPWKIFGSALFLMFIFYTNEKLGIVRGIGSVLFYLSISVFLLYYTYWRILEENKQKLIYYSLEFLIIIFGIYGVILIKEMIENILFRNNLISLSILVLIFTTLIILLHLRKKFS